MENNKEFLMDKEHKLLFGVRRSIRYHMRRCRLFDAIHSFTSFVGVFAGSGAAVTFLYGHHLMAVTAALVVAFTSSIDLVVGTGPRARLHNELAKRFVQLEKDMVLSERSLSEETLECFTARRLEIEADEPPILRTLDLLCHNELSRAMGLDKEKGGYIEIPALHRFLADFISFGDPVKV